MPPLGEYLHLGTLMCQGPGKVHLEDRHHPSAHRVWYQWFKPARMTHIPSHIPVTFHPDQDSQAGVLHCLVMPLTSASMRGLRIDLDRPSEWQRCLAASVTISVAAYCTSDCCASPACSALVLPKPSGKSHCTLQSCLVCKLVSQGY